MHNVALARMAEALCDYLDDSARSSRDLAARIRASIDAPGRPLVVPADEKPRMCAECGLTLDTGRGHQTRKCLRKECVAARKKAYNDQYYAEQKRRRETALIDSPRLCHHCKKPLAPNRPGCTKYCKRAECEQSRHRKKHNLPEPKPTKPPLAKLNPDVVVVPHGPLLRPSALGPHPSPPPVEEVPPLEQHQEEDGSVAEVRASRAETLCLTCKKPVTDIGFHHCYNCRTREAGI